MLLKKTAILSSGLILALGLVTSSSYAWHTHYHYAKTVCRGGVCHKWTRNVYRACGPNGCRTWRNHFHYRWRR